MRQTIQSKTVYQCSKCKTKYSRKRDAAECEKRAREKKAFRVGDVVRNIEPRTCSSKNRNYRFSGKVVKILGPNPPDFEYEVKWLRGKSERLNSHVFTYEVAFTCPHCKEKQRHHYYAPELKAAS